MPDLSRYAAGMLAAAITSLLISLAGVPWSRTWYPAWRCWATLAGIYAGVWWGEIPLAWLPTTALQRFLEWILPIGCLLELLEPSFARLARARWHGSPALRIATSLAISVVSLPILILNSAYVRPEPIGWSWLAAGGYHLASTGWLLAMSYLGSGAWPQDGARLPSDLRVLLGSATIMAAGICVLLGGYLQGGQFAFILAAAVLGRWLAEWLRTFAASSCHHLNASVDGLAVPASRHTTSVPSTDTLALWGILWIGHLFGRLSLAQGALLSVVALLIHAPRALMSDNNSSTLAWRSWLPRTLVILGVLTWLLWSAKRDFDQRYRPLLHQPRKNTDTTASRIPNNDAPAITPAQIDS